MPKTKSKSKTDNFDLMEYLQLYHNSKFNLYIDDSQLFQSGKGVYTNDFIPANSFVDFYEGNLIEFIKGGIYYFQINDKWGIDGFGPPRCYMAMLNDANFKPINKNKNKNKSKGKQITISNNFSNNCTFMTDEENLTVSIYSIIDIEP